MKTPKTKTIFRKWRDTGDIIALFTQDPGTYDPHTCSSYMHVGQHGSADPLLVMRATKPATFTEYHDLASELHNYPEPYRLDIRQRTGRADLEIRRKQLAKMK